MRGDGKSGSIRWSTQPNSVNQGEGLDWTGHRLSWQVRGAGQSRPECVASMC